MSTINTSNDSARFGAEQLVPLSKTQLWAGRIVSTLAVLFLVFDSVIKVLTLAPAVEATTQLGYPADAVMPIGLVELVCLAIYLWPRTAVLGAILLTGYLGGAIATHVHNGSSLFQLVFPVLIGAMVWGGLFLRERRLWALIPLRQS